MSRPIITAIVVFEKLPESSNSLESIMTKEFNNEEDAHDWVDNILPYNCTDDDCKYSWCILFGVKLSHGDFERTDKGTTTNVRND